MDVNPANQACFARSVCARSVDVHLPAGGFSATGPVNLRAETRLIKQKRRQDVGAKSKIQFYLGNILAEITDLSREIQRVSNVF